MRLTAWSRAWLPLLAFCLAAGCGASTGPAARTQPGRSPAAAAARWRVVSYRGVHVTVPAAWPVVDGMHTQFCGSPFPATATAFTGPNENGPPSCPAPRPAMARDGVWLQPGRPPAGARAVTVALGTVVREQRHPVRDDVEQLWFHRVQIEIGIGPDPRTAGAILRSVGYAPGEPDSRAAGRCARSAQPGSMPQPRRLTRRLVLDQGDVTLEPPAVGDRPTMPASRAWRAAGADFPFQWYRLLLARYSAKLLARQNADGSLTPEDRNVLAWVIYGQPRTPITGCGGWSLDAFYARTGQQIVSSGWSPGP